MKYAINAVGVPAPIGPYSQGTTAGRLVFVTGQIAISAENPNKLIDGDIEEQLIRVIHLTQAILAEADCTLSDVAQVTIYLSNINDLPKINEIYKQYFVLPAPSRAVVEVSALPLGALIEMDCIACR
ncbi:MAG: RidA family protein [Atopobiaceae bacterium]|nr:RidA family protein [Atopobiaceae bacterium]